MFSRLLTSARNRLFSNSSTEEDPTEPLEHVQLPAEEVHQMVVTRSRGALPTDDTLPADDPLPTEDALPADDALPANDALLAEDSPEENDTADIYVQTPKRKASRISKLQEEEEDTFYTPSTSKKPKIAEKPADERPLVSRTRLVVEIPAMSITPAAESVESEIRDPLAVRTQTGDSKVVGALAIAQLPEENTGATDEEVSLEVEQVQEKGVGEGDTEEEPGSAPDLRNISPQPSQIKLDRKSHDDSKLLAYTPKLPDLLPAEFLQVDEDEASDVESVDIEPVIKGKKTKFADELDVKPRDRRVGTTTYRVAKPHSMQLAPKVSAHSRSIKEAWLEGRSGKKGVSFRKPFKSGFFVR